MGRSVSKTLSTRIGPSPNGPTCFTFCSSLLAVSRAVTMMKRTAIKGTVEDPVLGLDQAGGEAATEHGHHRDAEVEVERLSGAEERHQDGVHRQCDEEAGRHRLVVDAPEEGWVALDFDGALGAPLRPGGLAHR